MTQILKKVGLYWFHFVRHSKRSILGFWNFICRSNKNILTKIANLFLAHLSQGLVGELIVYLWSGFCPSTNLSTISNNFSETAWPIKAKFYVRLPWVRGIKVCCSIRVTWPRWPPRPYKVNTLQKSSSVPMDRLPWNLVCSIRGSIFCLTLGWHWSILQKGQILLLRGS